MREVGDRFAPPPAEPGLLVEHPGLSVSWRDDLFQTLISGDLEAAAAAIEIADPTTDLYEIVPGGTAAIRIGRDRMLVVGTDEPAIVDGWREAGWAATRMDDGYAVLEISGDETPALLQEAMSVDLECGSPSAATQFVGCWALLYRLSQTTVRLHLEAPNLPYVAQWLQGRTPTSNRTA